MTTLEVHTSENDGDNGPAKVKNTLLHPTRLWDRTKTTHAHVLWWYGTRDSTVPGESTARLTSDDLLARLTNHRNKPTNRSPPALLECGRG